ncbi:carbohydrate kinase [Pelomonas sp. V22]|uniref:carbohydrate kinase family protein n=1 Tax=Pelomonas sp. V22 TaxID=2822139 RepID=UPI0024A9A63C|nr:carbohydrate kinase [Pelomonas sp. V22]MDI4632400.1 carbohydrate kinase [Pelomonas sp. V22]
MSVGPLPGFVAFGEALTDLIRVDASHWRSCDGGAPWNLARAMQGLGVASAFAGAVSRDVFGQSLVNASVEAGLDRRYVQQLDKAPLLAIVHETRPPQYFFVGDDSADLHFDPARLPKGWREALRWAHFGGISLAREPLAGRLLELAEALKRDGKRVSYDPNFRAALAAGYAGAAERLCRIADVIKVSDEDLLGLFPGRSVDEGVAQLRAWNPQAWLMVTRGAQGGELLKDDARCEARPPAIKVVDTVGAGDASMAGLLFSLLTRPVGPVQSHLQFAMAAGAAACTRAGPVSLSVEIVEALLLR